MVDVHLHAVDDLVEVLAWEVERFDHRRKRPAHRVIRLTGEHPLDLRPPPGHFHARRLGLRDFVDDVIHFPAERVQRRNRAAPLFGQEQEAVVEARPARGGLLLAVLIGIHGDAAR